MDLSVVSLQQKKQMRGYPELLGFISGLSAAVVFLIAHLLAVYIASGSGIGSALLTLILPVLSEIYWISHLHENTGSFLNALTFLTLGSIVLFIMMYGFSVASKETA